MLVVCSEVVGAGKNPPIFKVNYFSSWLTIVRYVWLLKSFLFWGARGWLSWLWHRGQFISSPSHASDISNTSLLLPRPLYIHPTEFTQQPRGLAITHIPQWWRLFPCCLLLIIFLPFSLGGKAFPVSLLAMLTYIPGQLLELLLVYSLSKVSLPRSFSMYWRFCFSWVGVMPCDDFKI